MIGFFKKFFGLIAKLNEKKIGGEGLAVLRITYALILMCEIAHFYYFRQLFFATVPFIENFELGNFALVFLVWECVLFLLMIGAFTRTAAIVNYVLTLVFISRFTTFEYHVMYAYTGVNFLLMFTDISKCFSVDRTLLRLKYSTTKSVYDPPTTVSAIHYLAIPFVGMGFVYFDSVFYKFGSHLWTNGMGMWLPASLPFVTHVNMSWLLNMKWLVLGMGYLTLVFETLFIFTFWNRFARIPLLIVGLGLHAGIVLVFPIPLFGLCMLAIYATMVPVSWWKAMQGWLCCKSKKLSVFYDGECPFCIRTRVFFESLDLRQAIEWKSVQAFASREVALKDMTQEMLLENIHCVHADGSVFSGYDAYRQIVKSSFCLAPISWVMRVPPVSTFGRKSYSWIAKNRETTRCSDHVCGTNFQAPPPVNADDFLLLPGIRVKDTKVFCWCALFVFLAFLQLNVTMKSIVARRIIKTTHLDAIGIRYHSNLRKFSKSFFGITAHPVFMDSHFEGYNSISAYEWESRTGEKTWLPIIDEKGMPGPYIYGANWVAWTFRFNSRSGNLESLAQRVPRWLIFWAGKNGVDLADGKFNIYLKRVEVPTHWENDFLNSQLERPFRKVGEATWNGTKLDFSFDNGNIASDRDDTITDS